MSRFTQTNGYSAEEMRMSGFTPYGAPVYADPADLQAPPRPTPQYAPNNGANPGWQPPNPVYSHVPQYSPPPQQQNAYGTMNQTFKNPEAAAYGTNFFDNRITHHYAPPFQPYNNVGPVNGNIIFAEPPPSNSNRTHPPAPQPRETHAMSDRFGYIHNALELPSQQHAGVPKAWAVAGSDQVATLGGGAYATAPIAVKAEPEPDESKYDIAPLSVLDRKQGVHWLAATPGLQHAPDAAAGVPEPAPKFVFSDEELMDYQQGNVLLSRLMTLFPACSSARSQETVHSAARLLLSHMTGRTIWAYMTRAQQDELINRAQKLGPATDQSAVDALALITRLVLLLQGTTASGQYRARQGMPEDIDGDSYECSPEERQIIDRTLGKLWTMVLSGIAFSDTPSVDNDAAPLFRDVLKICHMVIELTTRAEILCLAKMIWPKLDSNLFRAQSRTEMSEGLMHDLGDQLFIDGIFTQKASWLKSAAWNDDLDYVVPFNTAALPRSTHGQGGPTRTPGFLDSLKTEVTSHMNHDMRVPVLEPGVTIARVLPGLQGRTGESMDHEQATVHLRSLNNDFKPAVDGVEQVRLGLGRYASRLFNAMVTLPGNVNQNQRGERESLAQVLESGCTDFRTPEAQSLVIVHEIAAMHEYGSLLSPAEVAGLKRMAENTGKIKCSERMERAILTLHYNKRHCLLTSDHRQLLRFISSLGGLGGGEEAPRKLPRTRAPTATVPRNRTARLPAAKRQATPTPNGVSVFTVVPPPAASGYGAPPPQLFQPPAYGAFLPPNYSAGAPINAGSAPMVNAHWNFAAPQAGVYNLLGERQAQMPAFGHTPGFVQYGQGIPGLFIKEEEEDQQNDFRF